MTGLAPTEALAYRTLLGTPAASAQDLAARLGMSLMDVRLCLGRLEAKGLVGRLPGAATRYRASPPRANGGRNESRRRTELRSMRADIESLADEYRTVGTARAAAERVEVLPGEFAAHAVRLVATATIEVCAIVTVDHPTGALSSPRGEVAVRAVYPRHVLADPAVVRRLTAAVRVGAGVRVIDEPPLTALVVDRVAVLVPLRGDTVGTGRGALLIHPGGLQDAVLGAFDRTWASAEVVRVVDGGLEVGEPTQAVPCPEDLRLLALLLAGLTDEAIASRLDLGARTVQRRVRDLIELAGVRTRLQLIWHATRHGWI